MEEEKKKFEAERKATIDKIPEAQRDMFGQIGFWYTEEEDHDDDDDENGANNSDDTPASFHYAPVLIVSPFDVPPRPVRDIYWMDMFTKSKRSKKKLAEMDYLVYHYGSDDPDDCYNFVPQKEFITYEAGCLAGHDKLSSELQAKVKAGAPLTAAEHKKVRGLAEMEEDSGKPAQERKRGVLDFLERYEEKHKTRKAAPSSSDDCQQASKKKKTEC